MSNQNGTSAKTLQTLPVPLGQNERDGVQAGGAAFAAQTLGSGGVRRGLRGGPPVLQAARSAYLLAAWSGTADRRATIGSVALKRV